MGLWGPEVIGKSTNATHRPQTFVKNPQSWKEWSIEVLEEEWLPMDSVYRYVFFTMIGFQISVK